MSKISGRGMLLAIFLMSLIALPADAAPSSETVIRIDVDLTEAPQRIFHARLTMPVSPGPLTLLYPKWMPGEHGPTGPIVDSAGLIISGGGRPLAWERDPLDMFTFHVKVPKGVKNLEIQMDYLSPSAGGRFSNGPATSDQMAVLSWNTVLLYPAGPPADDILYQPRLMVPPSWQIASAMKESGRTGEWIEFEPVSLTTLVDSPLATGAHLRVLDLTPQGGPPHRLNIVADSRAALAMSPEQHQAYRQLVEESLALFGAHHYREYDFLLSLSDHIDHFGLEHHSSSDNRLSEEAVIDDDLRIDSAGLLPHELVHSWNAKYRRPVGLATPDYQKPYVDDLLWVYEGLTSYLGMNLTARSGLWSQEHTRESLALIAAELSHRPGREWRPLADTARAAQVLFGSGKEWSSWRRGVDFYAEGVLIWLEADTRIRKETEGKKSLDDFCRRFHGGESGPPEVKPFTYRELLEELGKVARLDWDEFFDTRIREVAPQAPLNGIRDGGWKLVYTDEMNKRQEAREEADGYTELTFSLGLILKDKLRHPSHGKVLDVIPGLPAAEAGVAPGMKLLAVNGRRWSPDLIREAVRSAASGSGTIELLLENADFFRSYRLDYSGGERYPHLVRDDSQPDRLTEIFSPQAGPPGR